MKTNRIILAIAMAAAASLTDCKQEEEPNRPSGGGPPNEEELITTLILTFADIADPSQTYELRFTDSDGDGGAAAVLHIDTLPAGRTFGLLVGLLDESVNPADTVTHEVQAEDEEHQFFFQVSGAAMTVAYADQDANGQPVGVLNTAITGASSTGTITVTLRHEPNKGAPGVAAGDITNAGGETDIEVTFPLVIQ